MAGSSPAITRNVRLALRPATSVLAFRHRLTGQRKLHGLEASLLWHRGLGAVVNVGYQLASIGQLDASAIDARHAFAVDQEEMIDSGLARDIDIFAQLDIAFGAEDHQSAVAPGGKAVGREPVDAHIAGECAG